MHRVNGALFGQAMIVAQLALAQSTPGPEPLCAGEEDSACWLEVANRPGCYVWKKGFRYLGPGQGVHWDGGCEKGRSGFALATGSGQLRFREPGDSLAEDRRGNVPWRYLGRGELREGKKEGLWTDTFDDSHWDRGTYVLGRRQGRWTLGTTGGGVSEEREGPYVDDKKHGHWVERFVDLDIEIVSAGPYTDDRRHGTWAIRSTSGRIEAGPYVDGEKHGVWTSRSADGLIEVGPYVDGKRDGPWIVRSAEGRIEAGLYVEDKKDGLWTVRLTSGLASWERCYANGLEVETC